MVEYFWYVLAPVLAGVGTGLVGLSAALAGHRFGKHHVKLPLAASIFGAYTELISKNGYDTVTVPLMNTAFLTGKAAAVESSLWINRSIQIR